MQRVIRNTVWVYERPSQWRCPSLNLVATHFKNRSSKSPNPLWIVLPDVDTVSIAGRPLTWPSLPNEDMEVAIQITLAALELPRYWRVHIAEAGIVRSGLRKPYVPFE